MLVVAPLFLKHFGASAYLPFCGPLHLTPAFARRWRTMLFFCGCFAVSGHISST